MEQELGGDKPIKNISSQKLMLRDHFRDIGVDGTILVLSKYIKVRRVWTGFN